MADIVVVYVDQYIDVDIDVEVDIDVDVDVVVVYYDVDVGIDVDGSPLEISNSFLIFFSHKTAYVRNKGPFIAHMIV